MLGVLLTGKIAPVIGRRSVIAPTIFAGKFVRFVGKLLIWFGFLTSTYAPIGCDSLAPPDSIAFAWFIPSLFVTASGSFKYWLANSICSIGSVIPCSCALLIAYSLVLLFRFIFMSSVKLRYSVVCLMFSELKKPPFTTSPLAISTSNIDFLVNSFASKLALSNAFFDVISIPLEYISIKISSICLISSWAIAVPVVIKVSKLPNILLLKLPKVLLTLCKNKAIPLLSGFNQYSLPLGCSLSNCVLCGW